MLVIPLVVIRRLTDRLAGFQGQVDFATFNLPWGRRYALVVVVGYSRLLWLRFYPRQNIQALFARLESSFSAGVGIERSTKRRPNRGSRTYEVTAAAGSR